MTQRRRRCLRVAVLIAGLCGAIGTAAPSAFAFRAPNAKERQGVLRAFDKKHGKKAKSLFVQDIRMSTANSRYGAVLYDDRIAGLSAGIGSTTVEYYKRVSKHATDLPRASASSGASIIDDFTSLGQNAPASVRDDEDPMYRVTFSTTTPEQIKRVLTWTCPDGSQPTTTSTGTYQWSVAFPNVALSRKDFDVHTGTDSFSGTDTLTNPCGKTVDGCAPGRALTSHYSGGGVSVAQKQTGPFVGGAFHSGYLLVKAGSIGVPSCLVRGALPIPGVQVGIPLHWPSSPIDDQNWTVDDSDFFNAELDQRLGDCTEYDGSIRCSESVVAFQGIVRAARVRRR